jgi:hypothetical protein
VDRVNAAIVHGKIRFLFGESCSYGVVTLPWNPGPVHRVIKGPGDSVDGLPKSSEAAAHGQHHEARRAAMCGVNEQQSAEAVVVGRFPAKGRTGTIKEEPWTTRSRR